MRQHFLFAAVALLTLAACQTGRGSTSSAPAVGGRSAGTSGTGSASGTVRGGQTVTMRRASEVLPVDVPQSTEAAIRVWRPFRPSFSGAPVGCLPLPPNAVQGNAAASFGNTRPAEGTVSILIDGTGSLVHYSETRGVLFTPDYPNARTDAERDSIMDAARRRTRFTRITLDYISGRASAANYGGELPIDAIGGTVAQFEALPFMSDLTSITAAVRTICGK